ncbi:MAG: class I SAM-dependent methyltransferase [Actinobacteria bacterium]|nr:class I SAM-dependent methyltransferase [Actinomycetota bacterium]
MDSQEWDERYAAHDLVWSAGPNRMLADEVGALPPGRALDVACGEGRNALWLAANEWTVTAVDFSRVALDKAQRIAKERKLEVEWVLADVVEHTPSARAYDLVVVLYLQLAGPERRRAFATAADAVAPGGTLLVIGHDSTNIADGFGGPQDPAVLYGPDDVAADLGSLQIVKAERVYRPVETDAGPRTAIDVLVRAARPA